MSEDGIDERVVEDFMIDLAAPSDASNSDSPPRGKGEEEVSSSRKRISSQESEWRKIEDLLVASGTEFFMVYHSCVREEDVNTLRSKFGILEDFVLQVPAPTDRPNSLLEGFLCLYVAQLEAGLRFPIPSHFAEISTLFWVPLNQFAPKAFRIVASFHILVRNLRENPSAAQLHSFFMLKKISPSLFYFTFDGDAHFLPSNTSVKE
ncbi:UNVERIFIED_CONTAM: hypothetical protein Sradi_2982400 [Sesamum radiatum]|uniref:Uncharacterized protein n=1 Tax=Sesamum radiatum TaxID=300843 RepID=A0AAW2S033_SESRA